MSSDSTIIGRGMTSQRSRDRLIDILQQQGIENKKVLETMAIMPRHLFIDEALSFRAYDNLSLPIGYGQTISQPYMVARMTELLLTGQNVKRVLEVGTGPGYQTAILSRVIPTVFSVERIKPLLDNARSKFRQLKLNNILTQHSDGGWGWLQKAPFDAIIVTAAPEELPEALIEQLVEGGQLIIPVGKKGEQELFIVKRTGSGFSKKSLEKVSFVPLLKGRS